MKKKIAIFTGNRAEFGLLLPVIQKVENDPDLELQLFVSGGHLEDNFGKTIELINNNGIRITEEIAISLEGDDLYSTSQAIGNGIVSISEALKKHTPDILMVYADRFEGFAAVISGSQMGIPIAHLEGGDITEGGALDDSVRHAMTKLSHIHFTTNQQAKENLLKMGEEEWRVFNAGLPSIDHITQGKMASKEELVEKFGIDLNKPVVLFTQHSVTTEFSQAVEQIKVSLDVIKEFAKKGFQFFITYPNNDAGGKEIIKKLEELKSQNIENLHIVPTLGGYNYHGFLSLAKDPSLKIICMGNSSSGIKETPIFACPTINIGSRQDGRLQAENVINVGYSKSEISNALETCASDLSFREKLKTVENPYGDGNASKIIVENLKKIEINKNLIQKKHLF